MSKQCCIIIGASHAAAQLAPSLRKEGWKGRIIVIGEEVYLPYHRPPISKTFLAGGKTIKQLLIRPIESYESANIEIKLGVSVVNIDRKTKSIELNNGEILTYTKLALTLGSRVRSIDLPGINLDGIYYLRGISDAEKIRPYILSGKKVIIVGGGYVGLETAAMLNTLGMEVTVIEMGERILNRVTIPKMSNFYMRIHREEGVHIITNTKVSGFKGTRTVREVHCSDGTIIPADLVIIGIGILPNVELAERSEIEVDDGIVVDAQCSTNDPDIVAAGDCTRHFNPIYNVNIRLESVQNAVDQAKIAASTICGKNIKYNSLPWFWSDQFNVKLQIAGLSIGYDEIVIRGDLAKNRKFAIFYLKNNKIISVDAVNSPQEFMIGKQIINSNANIDKIKLVNPCVPMKTLLVK